MPEERLIPETMVKLLFDQVKDSAEKNTQAIREFSGIVSELSQLITNQPTRAEVMSIIKEHDAGCSKRGEEIYAIIEKEDTEIGMKINSATEKILVASKNIDDAVRSLDEIKTTLSEINKNVNEIGSKIKTMITVVLVAFGVTMAIFYFVKSASDVQVNNAVQSAVQKAVTDIITTRPSNVWPLPEHQKNK